MKAEYITDEKDPLTGLEKGRPVDVKYIHGNHLMMLWTQYGALDIFDYIPGWPDSDPAKVCASAVDCGGVLYASRADTTKMKLKAARPKDIADITEIGEYETLEERILADILIGDEDSPMTRLRRSIPYSSRNAYWTGSRISSGLQRGSAMLKQQQQLRFPKSR
jgi:hypothetical protein